VLFYISTNCKLVSVNNDIIVTHNKLCTATDTEGGGGYFVLFYCQFLSVAINETIE